MSEAGQTSIQPYDEMNRYEGRDDSWPSDVVYLRPKRTVANGWQKFHAARDCGTNKLQFVESAESRSASERYDYRIHCRQCGYEVPEDEVLFVGGDWWADHGWKTFGRPLDDLWLSADRVLELGPDPNQDGLRRALTLTRIERESGKGLLPGLPTDSWRPCNDCANEVPIRFDGRCRMCYDGEWTDRMQASVNAVERIVRVWLNDSYAHRLEETLTPSAPTGIIARHVILWRRFKSEQTSKLVEVVQRLTDHDDGHLEYVLTDPTRAHQWRYRQAEIDDRFWSTGLHTNGVKPTQDRRIRKLWDRLRATDRRNDSE